MHAVELRSAGYAPFVIDGTEYGEVKGGESLALWGFMRAGIKFHTLNVSVYLPMNFESENAC